MRLIDADKILEIHRLETKLVGKDWTIDDLAAAIEYAPTLDVMPVVHGHWIYFKGGRAECSECHYDFYDVYDIENSDNYCRHCGAKMN